MLRSWLIELRGQHKSPHTLRGYRSAVRSFLGFCHTAELPPELSRKAVTAFMVSRTGEASTARLHLVVLKLFAKWLADETGFDASGVLAVRPPKEDQKAVPNLTDAEVLRLLKACDGRGLPERRDKAMLMLFIECGLRASEMVALDVTDVDLESCTLIVIRGKGGRGRRVRFSPATAAVLDRWLRARRQLVERPASGPLWISRSGRRLSYRGTAHALKERAVTAGVSEFHLHRLRHTAATRWLAAGGSETGLMAHAGWKSRTMIDRYTRAASEELAGQEFDRLHMGIEL
jgi:site-specific recombinase XerD